MPIFLIVIVIIIIITQLHACRLYHKKKSEIC
ncbi:Uncharacterised protein [Mycobacteroides abscessus subsp. abscessus]|nr:Uncharacterised protein [Mycobacteroides abscessus subsp. abscessus]